MADSEPELEPAVSLKKEKAIVALLNEVTVTKAAEVCGVGERTLYNWLKEPTFKAELRAARRDAFSQAIAMAQRYAPVAMTHLAKIATDSVTPSSVRVSALTAMLKFGREVLELDDVAARLEILEQAAKQDNPSNKASYRAN